MSTKDYDIAVSANPVFNNVLGLTNKTFDIINVRSGYMATEDQIQQLWQDIIRLEERIDYCCRDIVYWDFRVRILDRNGMVVTDFLKNRATGIMRRGKNFTMEIPLPPVPKYEMELPNGTTIPANFVDNDVKKCINNGIRRAYINDLCSIYYRGNEGQYYNMSARQEVGGLGFVSPGGGTTGSGSMSCYEVDANGVIGSVNLLRVGTGRNSDNSIAPGYSTSTTSGFDVNTHWARVENGKVLVDVYAPIAEKTNHTNVNNYVKTYGRIYQMIVRDVTLP